MATFTQENQDHILVYFNMLAPKHSMFLPMNTHKLRNMIYMISKTGMCAYHNMHKTTNNIFHDKYMFSSIGFHIFVEFKMCWKRMFETTCAKDNIFTQVTFY
jgi:hypothetical protein